VIVIDLRPDLRRIIGRLLGNRLPPRTVLGMEPLAVVERLVELAEVRCAQAVSGKAVPPRLRSWAWNREGCSKRDFQGNLERNRKPRLSSGTRDGAIIFGDLIGKLDMLRIECPNCGRSGRYRLADLIMRYGRDEKVFAFTDEVTANCERRRA
jgi:hypothetical protein